MFTKLWILSSACKKCALRFIAHIFVIRYCHFYVHLVFTSCDKCSQAFPFFVLFHFWYWTQTKTKKMGEAWEWLCHGLLLMYGSYPFFTVYVKCMSRGYKLLRMTVYYSNNSTVFNPNQVKHHKFSAKVYYDLISSGAASLCFESCFGNIVTWQRPVIYWAQKMGTKSTPLQKLRGISPWMHYWWWSWNQFWDEVQLWYCSAMTHIINYRATIPCLFNAGTHGWRFRLLSC